MKTVSFQNAYRPLLPEDAQKPRNGSASEASGFGDMLRRSLAEANEAQQKSDQAAEALATGRSTDIHQAMIAMEKAEISLQLMMQVRNKIVAAYDEIRRMQF